MFGIICEVCLDRPFTEAEIKQGTMNPDQIFEWHEHDKFDAIDDYEKPRSEAVRALKEDSDGLLDFDDEWNAFVFPDEYKAYIDKWIGEIRDATAKLTQEDWMFPTTMAAVEKAVTRHRIDNSYIYDPNEGDVEEVPAFLEGLNSYAGEDVHIYLGKIWHYKV